MRTRPERHGSVAKGGLEWMKAGNGVWHDGGPRPASRCAVSSCGSRFRRWTRTLRRKVSTSLPTRSMKMDPCGLFSEATAAPEPDPCPRRYQLFPRPPEARAALALRAARRAQRRVARRRRGQACGPPSRSAQGQLAVFEESGAAIELEAEGDTSFVLGSAIKHPHPLVLGYYSVHTTSAALAQGEAEINRIGQRLRAAGRL